MEGDVGGCGVHFILRTRDKKNLNIARSAWGCHKHSGTGNRQLSGGGEEVRVNSHAGLSLSVLKQRSDTLAVLTLKSK